GGSNARRLPSEDSPHQGAGRGSAQASHPDPLRGLLPGAAGGIATEYECDRSCYFDRGRRFGYRYADLLHLYSARTRELTGWGSVLPGGMTPLGLSRERWMMLTGLPAYG